MLVPAGLLTFMIWAVYTATRTAETEPVPPQRGVLKWIFLGLMLFGVGVILAPKASKDSAAVPEPVAAVVDTNTTPWIRFTFTAVELREMQGVRWLAIDYLDDVHGECQKSFPWETTIPGFKAETRSTEFITDAKDSSPAVRHQRVEYRMPDSSPRDQLERLRDNLEKALQRKSFRLELRENEIPLLLFELPGVEGGSLKARIKVVPPLRDLSERPLAFGAVTEIFLAEFTAMDLRSNRTKVLPAFLANRKKTRELDVEISDWLEREGMDFVFLGRHTIHGRMQNMTTLGFEAWNNFSPAQLNASVHTIGKVLPFKMEDQPGANFTHGFKTRDGALGLLKAEYTDNPPGVRIRYKLVQGDRTESAKPAARAAPLTGPPSSLLQFRLVADDADSAAPVDVMTESRGKGTSNSLRVLRTVFLDGSAVARAGIELETNGNRTIGIELTTEGARQFGAITAANINRKFAIITGGRVLSAPIIRSAISGGELQITGGMSADEVHKLVAELNRKPAGLEFSAAVERSLPRAPEFPPGAICLDLESGMFMTNRTFRADQRGTRDWLQTTGADLLAIGTADQIPVISGYDLAFIEAPTNAWNSLPPQEVGWNWTLMRDAAKQESQMGTLPGRPDTFLFRTRENGFGLLQVLYATNPSPVVNIRYKLVKDVSAK
jgi:hypothetical protein